MKTNLRRTCFVWQSCALSGFVGLAVAFAGCSKNTPTPPVVTTAVPVENDSPVKDTDTSSEAEPEAPSTVSESPSVDSQKNDADKDTVTAAVDADSAQDQSPPEATATNGESIVSSSTSDATSIASPTAALPPKYVPKGDVYRIVLLLQEGPMIVDIDVVANGASLAKALESLAQSTLRGVDTDGDGTVTWNDFVSSEDFRSGRFGNLTYENDEQIQQIIRIYDVDKDGLVDVEEIPRLLTRNAGGARSFSLASSNEYRTVNRSRSPTRMLIDADHDGAITHEEMQSAAHRLSSRDADADGVLVLDEVKSSTAEFMEAAPAMSNRRRTHEPETAVLITDPQSDQNQMWAKVKYAIQELYAYGDPISRSDWPAANHLFDLLDKDADGSLDRAEIELLATVSADIVLSLTFGMDGESTSDVEQIRIVENRLHVPEADVRIRKYANRLALGLPYAEVEFFVNEDPAISDLDSQLAMQFPNFDRDKNGYLDEEEAATAQPILQGAFAAIDTDSDKKIYLPEVTTFLRQRLAVFQSQVRARAADHEDALFSTLDRDGDGRLSSRELRSIADRLAENDRNQDGKLQSHEIPGAMIVGFVRGDPRQDDQLFRGNVVARRTDATDLPKWFVGMDGNADGEISAREFFGTVEQFRVLDTNGDGYVDQDELPSKEKELP